MIMDKYNITADNCEEIFAKRNGIVFTSVGERAFILNNEVKQALVKFIESVK